MADNEVLVVEEVPEFPEENGERESLTEKGINPLNVPSILEVILQYLPASDLLNTRLVSRLCGEESTKKLEKVCKLDLMKCVHDLANFTTCVNSQSTLSIGSFSHFNIVATSAPKLQDFEDLRQFFQLIGDKIWSFELALKTEPGFQSSDSFPRDTGLQEIWECVQGHAPNLKMILVDCGDDCEQLIYQYALEYLPVKPFPNVKHFTHVGKVRNVSWQSVFHFVDHILNFQPSLFMPVLPSLETITLSHGNEHYAHFVTDLVGKANQLNFQNPNPHLKKFDFVLNLNEQEIITFEQKLKYSLEYLSLSLRPGLRFPALYSFLSSLGSTLTTLKLDFVLIPPTPETFPCGSDLVNLKHLSFKNYYGPLDFIHHTPKLETICLTNVNLSVAFRDEPESSCEKVRSLEILSGHCNAGRMSFSHIFRKIAFLFPKLKKFRVDYLSDSNLKVIVEGCPLIEELMLVDSVCTDEGVTGFSGDKCSQLRNTLELNITKLETLEFPDPLTNERKSSVSTLKNLRKLHIGSSRMTDVSLLFGLSTCKNLEELCLSSPLISTEVLKFCVAKLNLRSLRLFKCYRTFQGGPSPHLEELYPILTRCSDEDTNPWPKEIYICGETCDICGVTEGERV